MDAMSGDLYRGREVEASSLLLVSGSETRMPFSQIGTCTPYSESDMSFTCINSVLCIVKTQYHVKEAGAALLLPHAALPEEELLRVAGNLRRGSSRDVAPGDTSPVALSQLLEAHKE